MKIREMNWSQVESYLKKDDRAVLPIGSTEQHAQLSLCVDYILSERVATEAAEPLGVPVFPGLPYGVTPYFMAFPGTISLKVQTYIQLLRDVLDSLVAHGFKRIVAGQRTRRQRGVRAVPDRGMDRDSERRRGEAAQLVECAGDVEEGDGSGCRGVACFMDGEFPVDAAGRRQVSAGSEDQDRPQARARTASCEAREYIGDGNYGGYYQRSDDDMLEIWRIAVEETREVIAKSWP